MTHPLQLHKAHISQDSDLSLDVRREEAADGDVLLWTVTNTGNAAFQGALRLQLELPAAFSAPWFMIPGFFYGENRRVGQRAPKIYPRFDAAVSIPANMTSCWWDVAAERTAVPLVFCHQDSGWLAFASAPHYGADPGVASDDPEPQVSIGFGHDGTSGHMRVTVPACEEPFAHSNQAIQRPTIRRLAIPPGQAVSGRLRIHEGTGGRHSYQGVLEATCAQLSAEHRAAALADVTGLAADAARGIIDGHYHADANYFVYSRPYDPVIEQIGNARGITMEWHEMLTGFVGGFPVCNALLKAAALTGDDESRQVAIRVADRMCREALSPSGLFWGGFKPGRVVSENGSFLNPLNPSGEDRWDSGWLPDPTRVHSRTISDACYNLAAMVAHEEEHHPESASLPLWRSALESNLRTALDLQLPNGCYGQQYDAVDRAVAEEEGCGGLPWIPAMIEACRLGLGGPNLVERMSGSLRKAGDGYAPYVEAENIWGAPEDNDSPTSEDGQNAVIAYTELYEFTGEERYLQLAVRAADWMLTFRKTYNEIVPPESLMGVYGMRSKGGDYASASNNHLHVFEVICTRHLCRIADWTGKEYYRERARDHWAFVCQYLSRCDGMYNGFRGAAAEQFYWCDYGSWSDWLPPAYHTQKGNMAPFTAIWCIMVILLAAPDAKREFYP